MSSQLTGAADVRDARNLPRGAWASRSGGGFTIVGTANATAVGNAALTASGGATHAGEFIGHAGSTRGTYTCGRTKQTTSGARAM